VHVYCVALGRTSRRTIEYAGSVLPSRLAAFILWACLRRLATKSVPKIP
jgi:hypothetical protein